MVKKLLLLRLLFLPSIIGAMLPKQTDLVIKQATVEDLSEVKELMRSVWFDTYTQFFSRQTVEKVTSEYQTVENLKQQLLNQDACFLLALVAQQLAGVLIAEYHSGEMMYVRVLYVSSLWRSKGIGAQLLQALMERHAYARVFRLTVKKANLRAVAFYERLGFKEVGQQEQTLCGETVVNLILEKRMNLP